MAGECILAIDQGTTNTKALLFDRAGYAAFKATSSVSSLQPKPGYVEQDPLELWQSTCSVIRDCASHAAKNGIAIAGISISNQRETAVAWRPNASGQAASGTPVSNAISWQCRRSDSVCRKLAAQSELLQERTGLPLDPLLTATKWAWLLNDQPELRREAENGDVLFGTVDSWLLYNLTGGRAHLTDLTNASRVALLNLATLEWDCSLLDLFEIPRRALPGLSASSTHLGVCTCVPELAGVPIVAMIGDSHAALVGHGCYAAATVKATYGTGSSLMMLTPGLVESQESLARTIACSLPGKVQYALEGNIAMSGAATQWVGEFLGLSRPVDDAAALAEAVPDAAGLILVPAMVGLGAPHWDAAARGLMCNLERSHTAAHLARASVDAIAHQVADVLEAMQTAAHIELPVLLADGGATRNRSLMQLQADLIGCPVQRSMQEELSARGVALLGGLTLDWWRGFEDLAALPNEAEVFEPQMSRQSREKLRRDWRLAVRRARLGSMDAS